MRPMTELFGKQQCCAMWVSEAFGFAVLPRSIALLAGPMSPFEGHQHQLGKRVIPCKLDHCWPMSAKAGAQTFEKGGIS